MNIKTPNTIFKYYADTQNSNNSGFYLFVRSAFDGYSRVEAPNSNHVLLSNYYVLDVSIPSSNSSNDQEGFTVNSVGVGNTYLIKSNLTANIIINDGAAHTVVFDNDIVAESVVRSATGVVVTLTNDVTVTIDSVDAANGAQFIVQGKAPMNATDFVADYANGFDVLAEITADGLSIDENADGSVEAIEIGKVSSGNGDGIFYVLTAAVNGQGNDVRGFSIDPFSGLISYGGKGLNADIVGGDSVTLTVTSARADGSEATEQEVIITVNDLNDVAPAGFSGISSVSIGIDNAAADSVVLTLPPALADVAGSTITYSLVDEGAAGTDAAAFSFDEGNRQLKVKTDLVAGETYNLSIKAKATFDETTTTATQNITVTVLNVSNSTLTFAEGEITGTATEGSNATIATVTATTDAQGATVHYTLTAGSTYFKIDESGNIRLRSDVDYGGLATGSSDEFTVTVQASDGIRTVEKTAVITVTVDNTVSPSLHNPELVVRAHFEGEVTLTKAHLNMTAAPSTDSADIIYRVEGLADGVIIKKNGETLAVQDVFTHQDVIDGAIVLNINEEQSLTGLSFSVSDGVKSSKIYDFSILTRTKLYVDDADANNEIDYSTYSKLPYEIDSGDGRDVITASGGDDLVKAGRGDDKIILNDMNDATNSGGRDEIIYEYDAQTKTATDGGDTITGFRRGEDTFTLSTRTYAKTQEEALAEVSGADKKSFADDQFIIMPDLNFAGSTVTVPGIIIIFRHSSVISTGRLSSNSVRIEFDKAMTWDEFLASIEYNGNENFDYNHLAVKNAVVLPSLLGEGGSDFMLKSLPFVVVTDVEAEVIEGSAVGNIVVATLAISGDLESDYSYRIIDEQLGTDTPFYLDGNKVILKAGIYDADGGAGSYTLKITAVHNDDPTNELRDEVFTFDIKDTHDEAADLMVSNTTIAENSTGVLFTANATPDAEDTNITYEISGDDAKYFTIDPDTGEVRAKPDTNLDVDGGKTTYSIMVTAIEKGEETEVRTEPKSVTITIIDVLEITVTDQATEIRKEGVAIAGDVVLYEATSDADATATVAWSLSGDDAGLFDINAAGDVTFSGDDPVTLNFEAKKNYNFTVTATDNTDISNPRVASQAVTMEVADVLEVTSSRVAASLEHNQPVGANTSLYTATADGDGVTWTIHNADNSIFEIDGTSGVVTFKSAGGFTPNFATKKEHVFTVIATSTNETAQRQVTLAVENDEVNSGSDAADLPENTEVLNSKFIYRATSDDTTITWDLNDIFDGDLFRIVEDGADEENGGKVFFIDDTTPDYETQSVYHFQVLAKKGGAIIGTKLVTLSVADLPILTATSEETYSVTENTTDQTDTGLDIILDDADSPSLPESNFTISGIGHEKFAILAASDGDNTFKLVAKAGQTFDAETKASYSLNIVAHDGVHNSNTLAVSIIVNDIDDNASKFGGDFGGAVMDALGDDPVTATGVVTVSDADITDGNKSLALTPQANLTGTYGSIVFTPTPDAEGGTIAGSLTWVYTLNREADATLALGEDDTEKDIFKVSAGGVFQTITITVKGGNDVPVITASKTKSTGFDEDAVAGSDAGYSFTYWDDDGDTSTTADQFTIIGEGSEKFIVKDNGGNGDFKLVTKAGASFDYETKANYFLIVKTTNSAGVETAGINLDVQVKDIAEDSTVSGDLSGTIIKGAATINGTIEITDADGEGSPHYNVSIAESIEMTGDYGTLSFDGTTWTYTLDYDNITVQNLTLNDSSLIDSFDIEAGGQDASIDITIGGRDEKPVVFADGFGIDNRAYSSNVSISTTMGTWKDAATGRFTTTDQSFVLVDGNIGTEAADSTTYYVPFADDTTITFDWGGREYIGGEFVLYNSIDAAGITNAYIDGSTVQFRRDGADIGEPLTLNHNSDSNTITVSVDGDTVFDEVVLRFSGKKQSFSEVQILASLKELPIYEDDAGGSDTGHYFSYSDENALMASDFEITGDGADNFVLVKDGDIFKLVTVSVDENNVSKTPDFDYETATKYDLTITATDEGGQEAENPVEFTVNILDIDEYPAAIEIDSADDLKGSVADGGTLTVTGEFRVTDEDGTTDNQLLKPTLMGEDITTYKGTYGTLVLTSLAPSQNDDGIATQVWNWEYTLDDDDLDTISLNADSAKKDVFTIKAGESEQNIEIDVAGKNNGGAILWSEATSFNIAEDRAYYATTSSNNDTSYIIYYVDDTNGTTITVDDFEVIHDGGNFEIVEDTTTQNRFIMRVAENAAFNFESTKEYEAEITYPNLTSLSVTVNVLDVDDNLPTIESTYSLLGDTVIHGGGERLESIFTVADGDKTEAYQSLGIKVNGSEIVQESDGVVKFEGTYGSITFEAGDATIGEGEVGKQVEWTWIYTLDPNDPDTKLIADGVTEMNAEEFTVTGEKGTDSVTIGINITGKNDAPIIETITTDINVARDATLDPDRGETGSTAVTSWSDPADTTTNTTANLIDGIIGTDSTASSEAYIANDAAGKTITFNFGDKTYTGGRFVLHNSVDTNNKTVIYGSTVQFKNNGENVGTAIVLDADADQATEGNAISVSLPVGQTNEFDEVVLTFNSTETTQYFSEIEIFADTPDVILLDKDIAGGRDTGYGFSYLDDGGNTGITADNFTVNEGDSLSDNFEVAVRDGMFKLVTKAGVDFAADRKPSYDLTITAKDGADVLSETEVELTININDFNENDSVFTATPAIDGTVTDGGTETATGSLTIKDSDFTVASQDLDIFLKDESDGSAEPLTKTLEGTYGTLVLKNPVSSQDDAGIATRVWDWEYTLNADDPDTIALVNTTQENPAVSDVFTVTTENSDVEETITITVNGKNEAPVITTYRNVARDGDLDPDRGETDSTAVTSWSDPADTTTNTTANLIDGIIGTDSTASSEAYIANDAAGKTITFSFGDKTYTGGRFVLHNSVDTNNKTAIYGSTVQFKNDGENVGTAIVLDAAADQATEGNAISVSLPDPELGQTNEFDEVVLTFNSTKTTQYFSEVEIFGTSTLEAISWDEDYGAGNQAGYIFGYADVDGVDGEDITTNPFTVKEGEDISTNFEVAKDAHGLFRLVTKSDAVFDVDAIGAASSYTLTVIATDDGGAETEVELEVNINDLDDNIPRIDTGNSQIAKTITHGEAAEATGKIIIKDDDATADNKDLEAFLKVDGDNTLYSSLRGTYGRITLSNDDHSTWTYVLDTENRVVIDLVASAEPDKTPSESVNETFAIVSKDGISLGDISITIDAGEDAPTIDVVAKKIGLVDADITHGIRTFFNTGGATFVRNATNDPTKKLVDGDARFADFSVANAKNKTITFNLGDETSYRNGELLIYTSGDNFEYLNDMRVQLRNDGPNVGSAVFLKSTDWDDGVIRVALPDVAAFDEVVLVPAQSTLVLNEVEIRGVSESANIVTADEDNSAQTYLGYSLEYSGDGMTDIVAADFTIEIGGAETTDFDILATDDKDIYQLVKTAGTIFDYENEARSYELTITATGAADSTTVTVNIVDKPEASTITDDSDKTITEGTDSISGTFTVTDADGENSPHYIGVIADGTVVIDGTYGNLEVTGNDWVYKLDNDNAAVIALGTNDDNLTDDFTVSIGDSSLIININVVGQDTNPVLRATEPTTENRADDASGVSITHNIERWHIDAGDVVAAADNDQTGKLVDGEHAAVGAASYSFFAREASGKNVTFTWDKAYSGGVFTLYNRDNDGGDAGDYSHQIDGSTVQFYLDDTAVGDALILNDENQNAEDDTITVALADEAARFNKVVLTFNVDDQSFSEIEISGRSEFAIAEDVVIGTDTGYHISYIDEDNLAADDFTINGESTHEKFKIVANDDDTGFILQTKATFDFDAVDAVRQYDLTIAAANATAGSSDSIDVTIHIYDADDNFPDIADDSNADGAVSQNGERTVSKTLTVNDRDATSAQQDLGIMPPADLVGIYGSIAFSGEGNRTWTYTLNVNDPDTLALTASDDPVTETFTVMAEKGSGTQDIDITITGGDDGPVIVLTTLGGALAESIVGKQDTGYVIAYVDDTGGTTIAADDLMITGDDADKFAIEADGSDFKLVKAEGAVFNYEEASSYSLTITITNPTSGQIDPINLTIAVTDIDDAAIITGAIKGAITHGDALSVGGTVEVADEDTNDDFHTDVITGQDKVEGTYGQLTFDGNDWTYTLDADSANLRLLAHGGTAEDVFTIYAGDGGNEKLTIIVTGKNDAPVLSDNKTDGETYNIYENTNTVTNTGYVITYVDDGMLAASDFSIEGTGSDKFQIVADGAGFILQTKLDDNEDYEPFDYEVEDERSYDLTIYANDSSLKSNELAVTINVIDLNDNDPIFAGDLTGTAVDSSHQIVDGTLSITDGDGTAVNKTTSVVWASSVIGTYGAIRFVDEEKTQWEYVLDTSDPQTYLLTGSEEQPVTDEFTIQTSDGTQATIVITVVGIADDHPALLHDTSNPNLKFNEGTYLEGTATGITFDYYDENESSSIGAGNIIIEGEGSDKFSVSGNFGVFSLDIKAGETFSYEEKNSYELTFKVVDPQGNPLTSADPLVTAPLTMTVLITDVDEPIVIGGDLTGAIKVGKMASIKGTIIVDDEDAADSGYDDAAISIDQTADIDGTYGTLSFVGNDWTYTLSDADDLADDVEVLAAGATFDETFTITADDDLSETITITVTGENNTPVLSTPGVDRNFNENTPIGTDIGLHISYVNNPNLDVPLNADDLDDLVITGTNSDKFEIIVDSTGTLFDLRTTGTIDYETAEEINFTIAITTKAAAATGITDPLLINFEVRDIDEFLAVIATTDANATATATGAEYNIDSGTTPSISGTLTVSDEDGSDDGGPLILPSGSDLIGTYGRIAFTDGGTEWTYTLDDVAVNNTLYTLTGNATDSFTVTEETGTSIISYTIDIIVAGHNEVPIITATAIGTGASFDENTVTAVDLYRITFAPDDNTTAPTAADNFEITGVGAEKFAIEADGDNFKLVAKANQVFNYEERSRYNLNIIAKDDSEGVESVPLEVVVELNDLDEYKADITPINTTAVLTYLEKQAVTGVLTLIDEDGSARPGSGAGLGVELLDGEGNTRERDGGSNNHQYFYDPYGQFSISGYAEWAFGIDTRNEEIQNLGQDEFVTATYTLRATSGGNSQETPDTQDINIIIYGADPDNVPPFLPPIETLAGTDASDSTFDNGLGVTKTSGSGSLDNTGGDAKTIQGGGGGDTIIAGDNGDLIVPGRSGVTVEEAQDQSLNPDIELITQGKDIVTLGDGADIVVQRILNDGGKWELYDGDLVINDFQRGIDKLILLDISKTDPIDSKEDFEANFHTTVTPNYNQIGVDLYVTKLTLRFEYDGNIGDPNDNSTQIGQHIIINFDQSDPSSLLSNDDLTTIANQYSPLNVPLYDKFIAMIGDDSFDVIDEDALAVAGLEII